MKGRKNSRKKAQEGERYDANFFAPFVPLCGSFVFLSVNICDICGQLLAAIDRMDVDRHFTGGLLARGYFFYRLRSTAYSLSDGQAR
jgi:hypothetical protein